MTRGELGAAARWAVAASALAGQSRAMRDLVRWPARPRAAAELPSPPDTALVRAARDHARMLLSPAVFEHSERCWHWASAFARIDARHPDAEPLYLACLLHDVALGAPASPRAGCFAALGGQGAAEFLKANDGGAWAYVVATAIARHMDPRTPEVSDEAALLHDAAHLDVAGRRFAEVPGEVVGAVLAAHPRTGFAREFTCLLRGEARVRPRSTAAVLWRCGTRLPIARNPLDRMPS